MTDGRDVMDRGGRAKRLIVAGVVGVICAVAAYGVLYAWARPDQVSAARYAGEATTSAGSGGAWKLVWYFTTFAFLVPAAIVLAVLERRAKQAWERARLPQARQVS